MDGKHASLQNNILYSIQNNIDDDDDNYKINYARYVAVVVHRCFLPSTPFLALGINPSLDLVRWHSTINYW